ncbi:hypothetical protein VNO78_18862 [Psophocarpus tetragonolobus]|uniref:Uncharacterized protein n=1 Tax=Psophocarpus tetragonolobus TaxID=3891 RepID=A0AAN9XG04_PSOTE
MIERQELVETGGGHMGAGLHYVSLPRAFLPTFHFFTLGTRKEVYWEDEYQEYKFTWACEKWKVDAVEATLDRTLTTFDWLDIFPNFNL